MNNLGLKYNDDYTNELVANITSKELAILKEQNTDVISQLADLNKKINNLYDLNKSKTVELGTIQNNMAVLISYFHTYRIIKQLSFWDRIKLLFLK